MTTSFPSRVWIRPDGTLDAPRIKERLQLFRRRGDAAMHAEKMRIRQMISEEIETFADAGLANAVDLVDGMFANVFGECVNTIGRDYAIAALMDDRPAVFCCAGYSNEAATLFAEDARPEVMQSAYGSRFAGIYTDYIRPNMVALNDAGRALLARVDAETSVSLRIAA